MGGWLCVNISNLRVPLPWVHLWLQQCLQTLYLKEKNKDCEYDRYNPILEEVGQRSIQEFITILLCQDDL